MQQKTILIIATTLFAITGVLLIVGDSGLPVLQERIGGSAGIAAASDIAAPDTASLSVSIPTPSSGSPKRTSDTSAIGLPTRVKIPGIGVNAPIEYVGTNAAGQMQAPSNGMNVAWYKGGARPGEAGNAVLAGHLDTFTSRYGVFTSLSKINVGDDVYITDDKDVTRHFRVARKVAYGYRDAPIDEIFGKSSSSHLNMITCNGTWDSKAHTYSQRLIVYTDLIP